MQTEDFTKPCKPAQLKNILLPKRPAWVDGERSLFVADNEAASIAQRLIDGLGDHRHLLEAKIVLLYRTGKKASPDGLLEMGRARKATARDHIGLEEADFVVEINADRWPDLDDREKVALVDHELTHCAAVIAGRFVSRLLLDQFINAIGSDFIPTEPEQTDDEGRVLVRYFRRKGEAKAGEDGYHEQPLAWRMRKHDVQDFCDVIHRWGAWNPILVRLVDVLEEPLIDDGPSLFEEEGVSQKAEGGRKEAAGARRGK